MAANMDLSRLSQKTHKVSRGYTYTYYTSPAQSSKPTIVLFHGWPDTAALYASLINDYLVPNGYGVIAPDCLGYGGTSKPTSPHEYAWNLMTDDIAEILDAESIAKVISLGHDWGSAIAQRLYNFYPQRVIGLILINVAYIPPTGTTFDLDATNKFTQQIFGNGIYEYWHFFTAPDAAAIENANLESVYTVAFGHPETWLPNWCTAEGMRKYVTEGRTQPTLPFAQGDHKRDFMQRFSVSNTTTTQSGQESHGGVGFEAPNCWYKAFRNNIQSEADKAVVQNAKVQVPTFFWGGEQDCVCRPVALQASIDAGLLPEIKSQTRPGGHWALLETPQEFGQDVLAWLHETYGSS